MIHLARCAMGLPALILLGSSALRSQAPTGPSRPPASRTSVSSPAYEESAGGLRLLLLDVLAEAKNGNNEKAAAFVNDMEIPNYADWFTRTYGAGKGKSSAASYGADLGTRQKGMRELFAEFARQDGEISTRKVNGAPEPGNGFEWDMLDSLNRPVNIFFASWNARNSNAGAKAHPIGYFMFIDGKFRWDSTIDLAGTQSSGTANGAGSQAGEAPQQAASAVGAERGPFTPGVAGVGFPSCAYCPPPSYSAEARAAGLEGTVQLKVVIEPDGRATNIELVRGMGRGLDAKAIEAVRNWRFNPAKGPNGAPVSVLTVIEVSFRLLRP